MSVLTGIDILGIQPYIFASNRLRDVLAASRMVEHVTSRASLTQQGVRDPKVGDVQVLLSAGGNAILECTSLESAQRWTAHYTRWLYDTAPGLEIVVAHRVFKTGALAWALKALQVDLARAKMERIPSAPQLGLSVTASCSITGLPAAVMDLPQPDPSEQELLSPRIQKLREQHGPAQVRWAEFLPELPNAKEDQASFPTELDQMGRTHGDTSTLGVVHVDGNSVGQAITEWLDRCIEEEIDDDETRKQYREWSDALSKLGESVLRAVVQRAAAAVYRETSGAAILRGTPESLSYKLRSGKANAIYLPLRPILLGGDDLTFVCDGRVALDLATTALEEFAYHEIPHLGEEGKAKTLSACAGVALVPPHAPFNRSYKLSEALCSSAKKAWRESSVKKARREATDTGSWLDWHVGTSLSDAPIEKIRGRQFERGSTKFTMRPYPLKITGQRKQAWQWLEGEVLGPGAAKSYTFRGSCEKERPNFWLGSRNRIKRLRELVVEGGKAIEQQLEAWRTIENQLKLPAGLLDTGFINMGSAGEMTPLLDAIELLDLHLRLEPDPRTASSEATTAHQSQEAR